MEFEFNLCNIDCFSIGFSRNEGVDLYGSLIIINTIGFLFFEIQIIEKNG